MDNSGGPLYAFGPFLLDPAERRLLLEDEPLPVSPKVLDTLVALVEADGRLVTKEALMQRLWPDTIVEEVNLARNVSLLRKTLGEKDGRTYIETVSKSGYRFIAPITRVSRPIALSKPGIADLRDTPPAFTSSGRRPTTRRVLAGLVFVAVSLGAIAVWLVAFRSRDGSESALPKPDYVRATFEGNIRESALSPDATMVASVLEGPPMRLVVRDVVSGSMIETLRGHWLFHPKWSRDGSVVAVTWRPGIDQAGYLAVVPRLGGPPRKLLSSGFGTWSPDGKRFAGSSSSNKGFGVYGLDGVLVQDVPIRGFQWLIDLEWSRASDRLLLWTEDEQRNTILWSVSPDGAEVSRFYAPKRRLLGATWASDGSAVYVLRPVAESAELVKVPLERRHDGDEKVLIRGLTAGKGLSLSADGSKLLYRRVTSVANLWRVTVGDSVERTPATTVQLTRGASRLLSPVMSPDGRSIAFVRKEANDAVLQSGVLPLDGPPETLTPAGLNVESPAWSPDGSRIAFAAVAPGGNGLWMVGLNDRSRRQLSTGHMVQRDIDSVVWAPDGRLAYQTPDNRYYYLLDPGSGKEQRLGKTDKGNMFWPRFSPDGALVAVFWNRLESGPALWMIDLKTGAEMFIAKGIVPMGWSPGNRAIYGARQLGNEAEIIRVDRWTGSQTVVTRFPSGVIVSGNVSRDGRQIVCSVQDEIADAWIIENFDPQHTRRSSAAR